MQFATEEGVLEYSYPGGEQKNAEQVDVRENNQGWTQGPKDPNKFVSNIVLVKVVTDLFALWRSKEEGDDDDEVINTESLECCTIVRQEIQVIDTENLKFSHGFL